MVSAITVRSRASGLCIIAQREHGGVCRIDVGGWNVKRLRDPVSMEALLLVQRRSLEERAGPEIPITEASRLF